MRIHLLLPFLVFAACAPKPQSIPFEPTVVQAGPRLTDVDLRLDESKVAARLQWNEETSSATLFRMTENLLALRDGLPADALAAWTRTLWRSLPGERVPLAKSDYADLMAEQTEAEVLKKLDEMLPAVRRAPAILRQALLAQGAPLGRNEVPEFDEALSRALGFVNAFQARVPSLNIAFAVQSGLKEELAKRLPPLQQQAQKAIRDLKTAKKLVDAMNVVSQFLKESGLALSADTMARLTAGRKLGAAMDAYVDAPGALSVIIDIWRYLEPADRKSVFEPASPELYDYLKDQDDDGLDCLKNPDCPSFTKWLAKKIRIEPQLRAYGLEKLRAEMNVQGAAAARKEVRKAIAEQLRALPRTLADMIDEEVAARLVPFERLRKNYAGEMRARFTQWSAAALEKNGPSVLNLRPVRAKVSLSGTADIRLKWAATPTETLENVGSSSAVAPLFWRSAGLSVAERRAALLSEVAFVSREYRRAGRGKGPVTSTVVSARSHAEIVRGLSRLANVFRAPGRDAIDELVGGFRAADLFPEVDVEELDRPLFPKEAFSALSFASVGEHLETITQERSQVFLVDLEGRVTWANDFEFGAGTEAIMAGVVDRSGDVRAAVVRAEDVARYLLALCEFLESTRGIENSESSYLITPDNQGRVPRDRIVAAKSQIRLLVLGLANYLSHQFRAGGDLVVSRLDVDTQRPVDGRVTALDQALTVRALLAASRTLDIDLYRWEAVDLISAMNRDLFRKEKGFYAGDGETAVKPPDLLEFLRAFEDVGPYLGDASRAQLTKLSRPWREALKTLTLGTGG